MADLRGRTQAVEHKSAAPIMADLRGPAQAVHADSGGLPPLCPLSDQMI